MGVFQQAQRFTARWEGGYARHDADPGGETKYGISLRFLKGLGKEAGDLDRDGDIDGADIRALTPKAAARLLKASFWDRLDLDEVKPLCALVMYDTAVNMGVSRAVRLAQKALGVREDGIWGPVTRSALRVCDDRKCAAAMCHLRRAKYCELARAHPELSVFLRGWLRRVEALEEEVETA